MRLQQGDQSLDLTWIGGEPIENEGDQGTRSLPLWTNGDFIVDQRIPDWKGRLTQGIELTGSLRSGQVTAIYKLCADNQLSADVELLKTSGDVAQVRFTLGKAESAVIAGQSESAIAAMSKLGSWVEGTFRVVLRPAFGDEKAAEAPVFKGQPGDQFDVTGNVDLAKDQVNWPTAAGASGTSNPPRPASTGTPAQRSPQSNPPKATPSSTSGGNAAGSSSSAIPPRLAQTLIKAPAPAGLVPPSTAATMPMKAATKAEIAEAQKAASGSSNKTVVLISVIVITLCLGGIAAVLFLR